MEFKDRKKINTNYFMEEIAYLKEGWWKLDPISDEALAKAKILEEGFHAEKPKELQHKKDSHGRERRYSAGPRCEAKCKETYRVLSTFDNSVGDSRFYGDADFKALGVGVKASQFGSCAMVFQIPKSPEIIMSYTDFGDYYICGLAIPDVMLKYSSIERLNDPTPAFKDRPEDCKTGFYGYGHLIPLHDYYTIPKLKTLLGKLKERRQHA